MNKESNGKKGGGVNQNILSLGGRARHEMISISSLNLHANKNS
jgi:hypothetical protein